jgi:hypothetical protein
MFKVSPASLQTFIDTLNCVQYNKVRIPNMFCDGRLQIINCVGIVQRHTEFLITVYIGNGLPSHSAHIHTHSKVEKAEDKYSTNVKCVCLRLGINIGLYHQATQGCL